MKVLFNIPIFIFCSLPIKIVFLHFLFLKNLYFFFNFFTKKNKRKKQHTKYMQIHILFFFAFLHYSSLFFRKRGKSWFNTHRSQRPFISIFIFFLLIFVCWWWFWILVHSELFTSILSSFAMIFSYILDLLVILLLLPHWIWA